LHPGQVEGRETDGGSTRPRSSLVLKSPESVGWWRRRARSPSSRLRADGAGPAPSLLGPALPPPELPGPPRPGLADPQSTRRHPGPWPRAPAAACAIVRTPTLVCPLPRRRTTDPTHHPRPHHPARGRRTRRRDERTSVVSRLLGREDAGGVGARSRASMTARARADREQGRGGVAIAGDWGLGKPRRAFRRASSANEFLDRGRL
jgi:hypothetical protein